MKKCFRSCWVYKIKVGDEFYDEIGKVTVRSVFDGYVAFKIPRCAMAILKENKFLIDSRN